MSSTNYRFESQSTLGFESCIADAEPRCVRSQGGREYTVKCLKARSRRDSSPAGPVPLPREVEIHTIVSGHPHILPYRDCFVVDGHYHALFEACKGGHLGAQVQARQRFFQRDDEIKRVFLQLVSAVRHCHELGVAHRDLRPENFIASDYKYQTYYLANFDHATTQRRSSQLQVGTRPYTSPECLGATRWKRDYDTHASDVWSLGVVLIYMVAGTLPWEHAHPTDARYAEYTRDRTFLQSYLPVSEHLLPLLASVLEPEPRKRIGLADLAAQLERAPCLSLGEHELECADAAERVQVARERGLAVAVESSLPGTAGAPGSVATPTLAKQASLFMRLMQKMKK